MFVSTEAVKTFVYVQEERRLGMIVWALYITGAESDHYMTCFLCERYAKMKAMKLNYSLGYDVESAIKSIKKYTRVA